VAVASSSAIEKAEIFIHEVGIPCPCAAYGSYENFLSDANIDAVYIATPHSHHFQNVMMALEAGKHILCEKPLTVNANQAKVLCEEAKKRNLFLMEGMWTRFLPLCKEVTELVTQGKIGEVLRVSADTSFGDDLESKWGIGHRILNKDLAGGALLDCESALLP
jgi:predicted dehydrogenase